MSEDMEEPGYFHGLFHSLNGDLDKINAAIDAELTAKNTRKISVFACFIKARLARNPKILRLSGLSVSEMEAVYLSHYPGLEHVEILDLRQNHIGDRGFAAIAASPVLLNLRELDLRNNQITRAGLLVFAEAKNMSHLRTLDLRLNKLGGSYWLERLRGTGNFPVLSALRAGG